MFPFCTSVRFLQLTFEPLANSSGIWQRGRGLENNNIPANGTEIDSWVMERNPVIKHSYGGERVSSHLLANMRKSTQKYTSLGILTSLLLLALECFLFVYFHSRHIKTKGSKYVLFLCKEL